MPSTVCTPAKFSALCEKLNEDQIKLVHEMGLGSLLTVPWMSIRRILLESLADCYSERDRSFTVGEHMVPICARDVYCILGLLDKGEKITISKNRADPILFGLYKGEGETMISFPYLEKRIQSGEANEHFVRMFVLYAIGTLLAPCSKEYVSSHYLEVVADISKIKNYNWAEFTLEFLLTNLAKFKTSKRTGLVGNLALLQVWYFEHFQAEGDSFSYDLHEHPLIKNWDQKQCDKRMLYDTANKIGAGKVVMHLQVNDFDRRFTSDPIVDGMNDVSPKEMNNHNFEDEKKHQDLDQSDCDARCDVGHKKEGGESNFEARLRVVEERTRLVPQLYSKIQAIAQIVGYSHGLSPDDEMDTRSKSSSLQDQLSLIPIMAKLSGKKRPVVSEAMPCSSPEPKKLRRTYCKEDTSNLISPLRKKADPHSSTVVDTVKTMVNRVEEVRKNVVFSRETSFEKVKVSNQTSPEKVECIDNFEVSMPTSLEEGKSIEMFSSETLLENRLKSSKDDEVTSPSLVDKVKKRTHRKRSKICLSPYLAAKGRVKFVPDNHHLDDITRGLDLSDLDVAAIKFLQKELVLDPERVVVSMGQVQLTCGKMASLIRPVKENGVEKWLYDDIINAYAIMFNYIGAQKETKYALSSFDSTFLGTIGKEWLKHGKFIRKRTKRAVDICRSLIRHDMVSVPMNVKESHWWLLVVNLAKQEWQILDSYNRTLEYYVEVTKLLRNGVHSILQTFSSQEESRWSNLDVLSWPVVAIKKIPRQSDICSCGIFTIRYMRHWNGFELTSSFTQNHMETLRKKMPCDLLLSSSNEITAVGKEVLHMASVLE